MDQSDPCMQPITDYVNVGRFEDFLERYREDRSADRAAFKRIEDKLDKRSWSPMALAAMFGPMGAAVIAAIGLLLLKGGG